MCFAIRFPSVVLSQLCNLYFPPPSTSSPTPTPPQVCSQVFGSATGLVDMLVAHVPSAKRATAAKVARCYTGPQDDSPLLQYMKDAAPRGPLVVHIAKLFPKPVRAGWGCGFDRGQTPSCRCSCLSQH
jgi:U5 small nuclear ribonucleoprotein component